MSQGDILESTLDIEEEKSHSSEWLPKALRARPEILELYERTLPLSEKKTFGSYLSTSSTEAKHAISHNNVMQLILAFLSESGYTKTCEKLEKETSMTCFESLIGKESLRKILQMSVKDISTMLDPSLTQLENAGVEGDVEVTVFDFQETFQEDDKDTDINIWDEGPISKSNLVMESDPDTKFDLIVAGTCNKIIEYITSDAKGNMASRKFVLATYQSWMTPEKFFDKLIQRYNIPDIAAQNSGAPEKYIKEIRTRVALVLKAWMVQCSKDFSERLIEKLRDFVENRLINDGRPDLAKTLRSPLTKLMENITQEQTSNIDISKCPDPKVPKNIFSPLLVLDDVPKEEIARQMTIMDNKMFYSISVSEFLSRNWSKSSNIRSSVVAAIINRFNQIVKWVITSVLKPIKHKERARVVMRFLEIAQHLKSIQSYNSMAAIYFGLTHGAVYRLSHTFIELNSESRKTLTSLGEFLSPTDGYRTYIQIFESQRPPIIPFLGAHLQDISMVDETMPDNVGDMINLTKRKVIYEKAQKILQYQTIEFNFLPVRQIAVFLHKFDMIKSENEMYKLSLLREPQGISATGLSEYEESLQVK